MNEQAAEVLKSLATVATREEALFLAERTGDKDLIASTMAMEFVTKPGRRLSYAELLGIKETAEDVDQKTGIVTPARSVADNLAKMYQEKFSVSLPDELLTMLIEHNLDSPIILDHVASEFLMAHYGRLQDLCFHVRGQSYTRDYRAFREKDNVSGKNSFFAAATSSPKASSGSSKKSAATNNAFMLGDAMVRYPKEVVLQDIVALATPDDFWSKRKPAEVVMSKLFTMGAMGQVTEIDHIVKMADAMGAEHKSVAEQIRWTLDGSYTKYGWTAIHDEEAKTLQIKPVDLEGWDGFEKVEGYLSYPEFAAKKKKKA